MKNEKKGRLIYLFIQLIIHYQSTCNMDLPLMRASRLDGVSNWTAYLMIKTKKRATPSNLVYLKNFDTCNKLSCRSFSLGGILFWRVYFKAKAFSSFQHYYTYTASPDTSISFPLQIFISTFLGGFNRYLAFTEASTQTQDWQCLGKFRYVLEFDCSIDSLF